MSSSLPEDCLAHIMRKHNIPGAQLIYCDDKGTLHEYHDGVLQSGTAQLVTAQTQFQAASLSKVVAAYVTLRMVDQGYLALDTPLWAYWPSPRIAHDHDAQQVTGRMVLEHTSGFPDWAISPSNPAIDHTPLSLGFAPGTRFSYSGEGFYLLQKTLEYLRGKRWNDIVQQEVFTPFGMTTSSFLTEPDSPYSVAKGHDQQGISLPARVFGWENTAWTLLTTAHDYMCFIQRGIYRGEGLKPSTHQAMLRGGVATTPCAEQGDISSGAILWGLGVGVQITHERTLVWHWGDNPGFKSLFMLDKYQGEGIVLLFNSDNGPEAYNEVLRLYFGGGHYPAVEWIRRVE